MRTLNNAATLTIALAILLLGGVNLRAADATRYHAIHVLDEATGRGVPLVELRSVNDVSYWTDSAGFVAIDDPSLTHREVFFHVTSHGYEYPADGFGYRGVRLQVEPGQQSTLRLQRKNLAERLYRVTGDGIYRDSVLLDQPTPIASPLVNAGVVGSDSVLTTIYGGRIHWFWGDTNFANYPLGNFHVPGATSRRPSDGGLDPSVGVDLKYFADDDGRAKATCRMPGDGPTWIFGLTVIGDDADSQTMFAGYAKIKPPLDAYERGIAQWDDESEQFLKVIEFPKTQQAYPMGHPVLTGDYVYYCDPLPLVRVRPSQVDILKPEAYELYSYFADGSSLDDIRLDRDSDGHLIWKWRRGSLRLTRDLEESLAQEGRIRADERVFRLRTTESDRLWTLHTASIAWSEYRARWIMIGLEVGGESSHLGEVYYAESESLTGPWSPATKIITHDHYSFYNPRLHPMLTSKDGRHVYFEGTYTKSFSGASQATPRYDYNQIMYRLDLANFQ